MARLASLLHSAVDHRLSEPNPQLHVQICDILNRSPSTHNEICIFISKHLLKDDKVASLTLTLLESTLKNGSSSFNSTVALSDIPLALTQLIQKTRSLTVRQQILSMCCSFQALATCSYELVSLGLLKESSIKFHQAPDPSQSITELINQINIQSSLVNDVISLIKTGDDSSKATLPIVRENLEQSYNKLSEVVSSNVDGISEEKLAQAFESIDNSSGLLTQIETLLTGGSLAEEKNEPPVQIESVLVEIDSPTISVTSTESVAVKESCLVNTDDESDLSISPPPLSSSRSRRKQLITTSPESSCQSRVSQTPRDELLDVMEDNCE
ncbi:hypothetical protein P9112_008892 [Eukaryota sp. TZLM1-RC]